MQPTTTLSVSSKFFLLTIVSACIVIHSAAQHPIVLNYQNYLVPPTADYFQQGANVTGVTVPATGTNRTWDYGVLTKNNAYNYLRSTTPVTNPAFAGARRQYPDVFLLSGFIPIGLTQHESDNSSSSHGAGRSLVRQAFSIQALTGFPTDSLVIPQQTQFDNNTNIFLPYPCTNGTSWTSSNRGVTDFQLSVAAFGLDHVPGQYVQIYSRTTQVVGWGKMRVPLGAGKSNYIKVLMLKETLHEVDSVYLAGFPAPPVLLAAFGLTQGQQSNFYSYNFKRKGIDFELMTFNMNSTFSTIQSMQYDARYADIYCDDDEGVKMCINSRSRCVEYEDANNQLLDHQATVGSCDGHHDEDEDNENRSNMKPSTIISEISGSAISVYPNPSANSFTIRLDTKISSPASVLVFDLSGRQLLRMENVNNQFQFGKELKAGMYIVKVIQGSEKKEFKVVKTE